MNHITKIIGGLFILVAVIALTVWWSQPRYADISSGGYEISMALYSACNAESEERIADIETIVQAKVQQQEIDDREAAWFDEVFRTARNGQWRAAAKQSREILRAQAVAR